MKSILTGAGYVMNDNRASGGKLVEDDLFNCFHCQASIHKGNWKAYGENKCAACDGPVCSICKFKMATHGCQNFKRYFERAFEDRYRRDQNAKILGTL